MKKIIRILNLDIHSLNNAEYKNFMERFFKLIPLKAVSGEGDRPVNSASWAKKKT